MRYEITANGSKYTWETIEEARQSYHAGELKIFYIFGEDELKHDIENAAQVQGKAWQMKLLRSSKDADAKSSAYDIDTFLNVCVDDNWHRTLCLGLSDVDTALHDLCKHKLEYDSNIANNIEDNVEFVMELAVPEDFSDAMFVKLMRVVHDYLVSKVMWEWADLNTEELAQHWLVKMEADMKEIQRIGSLAWTENSRLVPHWVP